MHLVYQRAVDAVVLHRTRPAYLPLVQGSAERTHRRLWRTICTKHNIGNRFTNEPITQQNIGNHLTNIPIKQHNIGNHLNNIPITQHNIGKHLTDIAITQHNIGNHFTHEPITQYTHIQYNTINSTPPWNWLLWRKTLKLLVYLHTCCHFLLQSETTWKFDIAW